MKKLLFLLSFIFTGLNVMAQPAYTVPSRPKTHRLIYSGVNINPGDTFVFNNSSTYTGINLNGGMIYISDSATGKLNFNSNGGIIVNYGDVEFTKLHTNGAQVYNMNILRV